MLPRVLAVTNCYFGERFVSQTDVARFANKILNAFKKPIAIEKRIIQTSVSIGVALYPKDAKKPSELLRFSDMALYQAKKLGGNQFQFYGKKK